MMTDYSVIDKAIQISNEMDNPDLGLQTKHFRPEYNNNGGLTVVYYRPKYSKTIKFSLAVCSTKDQYNKRIGRYLATKKFLANETIVLPVNREINTVNFLNHMFLAYTNLVFN